MAVIFPQMERRGGATKGTLSLLALLASGALAQEAESIDSLLATAPTSMPVQATFDAVRVVESHSVETTGKGNFDLEVTHRFGSFGNGPAGGFGMDMANTRIGVDYGVTDRLGVGIERANDEGKPVSLWGKFRVLRQSSDDAMPVSVTWLSIGHLSTQDPEGITGSLPFVDRLSSTHQLIVARKFGESLSLQVSPTLVQRVLVQYADEDPASFGVGIAGRWKYSQTQGVLLDMTEMFTGLHKLPRPSIGLGWEIGTGGHIFQAHLVNSGWITEDRAYTRDAVSPGHFSSWSLGFLITRYY